MQDLSLSFDRTLKLDHLRTPCLSLFKLLFESREIHISSLPFNVKRDILKANGLWLTLLCVNLIAGIELDCSSKRNV
jgi:hypothetical protein